MKVVSFINEKGGTCKTTLAVNFAAYYAKYRNKRVLLVDLDSQGHAGKSLGINVREAKYSTYDLLMKKKLDPAEAILPSAIKKLDVICSNKQLADFPVSAARNPDRETLLYAALQKVDETYDYIFIDSPPSSGLVSTNILVATTDVVIPVALTYLSLDGCAEVVHSTQEIRQRVKEAKPQVSMVIPTMYRKTRLANEIVGKLAEYFPDRLSKTILGFSVRIDEAQSYGQTIWDYDPKGRGAVMLRALAIELYNQVLRK